MAPTLEGLCVLYRNRSDKTGDLSDLREASRYTDLMARSIPTTHPVWGRYFTQHVKCLTEFAKASSNSEDAEQTVRNAELLLADGLSSVPTSSAVQIRFALWYLLVRRYELSTKVCNFVAMVDWGVKVAETYNNYTVMDPTCLPVRVDVIKRLAHVVRRIAAISPQTVAGESVRRAVNEYF